MRRANIDVAVLCATPIEGAAARKVLREPFEQAQCGPARGTLGRLGSLRCLTLSTGLGRKRLRAVFEGMARSFKPRLLINFGAAGGLSPDIPVGAPTLPREIVAYKWPGLEAEGRPIECPAAARLVSLDPALRLTRAGSCPRDVFDAEIRDRLVRTLRLDTTDWETWFVADACRESGIPFLALRCVTDRADSRAARDYAAQAGTILEKYAALLEPLSAAALEFYSGCGL